MDHKRCVVHIARRSTESMQQFMGYSLPVNMDVVIAGAILGACLAQFGLAFT